MSRRHDIQDASGVITRYNPFGIIQAWGASAPTNGNPGFAKGCDFYNLGGATGTLRYVNVGSNTSATWVEITRQLDNTSRMVTAITTLTVTAALHEEKTILLSLAGGFTSTLPAATGTGGFYRFVVGVVSTVGYIINPAGSDAYKGVINSCSTAESPDLCATWIGNASTHITLNGTTTGGVQIGDWIEVQDIATAVWAVRGMTVSSGAEATPFS